MMYWCLGYAALAGILHAPTIQAEALVSLPGDKSIIPGWNLQSSTKVSADMASLSQPGVNVSSWYRVSSRGTVMAGLIENGVYDETRLFYSDNMETLEKESTFLSPWLYREEFMVQPSPASYYTLKTHGITSKADIYVNGVQVATTEQQQGSYGGHQYDLTKNITSGLNCILIKAYPTNYLRDFAMGFVDWNPYPADNSTGVWRNVEIVQTGAVSMSPLRILTDFHAQGIKSIVDITIKTDLMNRAPHPVTVALNGSIMGPIRAEEVPVSGTFNLKPGEKKTVAIKSYLKDPQVWWPASWGEQVLYKVSLDAMIQDVKLHLSDTSSRQFGVRHVSSYVNHHNDTAFQVNGRQFQVLGAGYAPDMFMRFDVERVRVFFQYMLDMGLNTVRLEGNQEHPELYDLADEMGLMVLAGWECCDKWEGWEVSSWLCCQFDLTGDGLLISIVQ